jgi:hypothetical protein
MGYRLKPIQRLPSLPPVVLLWCSSISPLLISHDGEGERRGGVGWALLASLAGHGNEEEMQTGAPSSMGAVEVHISHLLCRFTVVLLSFSGRCGGATKEAILALAFFG